MNTKEMDQEQSRIIALIKINKGEYIKNLNKIRVMDQTDFDPQIIANSFYSVLQIVGWECY